MSLSSVSDDVLLLQFHTPSQTNDRDPEWNKQLSIRCKVRAKLLLGVLRLRAALIATQLEFSKKWNKHLLGKTAK